MHFHTSAISRASDKITTALPVSHPLLFGLFRHSAFILRQRPLFLGRVLDPGAVGSYYIIVRGNLVLEKITFGIEIIPGGNAIPAKLIPAVCRVRIIRVAVPPAALSPDPALTARIAVGCLIGCDRNTLPLSVLRYYAERIFLSAFHVIIKIIAGRRRFCRGHRTSIPL